MGPADSGKDEPPKVLTVAGSDSGGAAGLQADLKTFEALGVYGMSVVTAVTAQNSVEVRSVYPIPAESVADQFRAVIDDYGADAVKTGFLGRTEIIRKLGELMQSYAVFNVVVDPVLVNHLGESMFPETVAAAYIKYLLPLARLITPNLSEASILSGVKIRSIKDMEEAGDILRLMGAKNVLITGFRMESDVIDLLIDDGVFSQFRAPWIETENTHGSGDTVSAAISAFVARGLPLMDAVAEALQFTQRAIQRAVNWRLGDGHGPVGHQNRPRREYG